MNILIRADGGKNIGLGHIIRTLALANELKSENNVTYICSNKAEFASGRDVVRNNQYNVIEIDDENEVNSISAISGDVLIVDKYNINEEKLKVLSEKFVVMYIDDNNELEYYPVQILLNHNVYGDKFNYKCKGNILAGNRYTLIRDEFKEFKAIEIKKEVEKMIVTVGGSDNKNLTQKIIEQLPEDKIEKHIVVTNAFIYKEEIYNLQRKDIIVHCNPNMAELMNNMDLAIAACGSTINELSYLGVPTIGIVVADNQNNLAEYMKNSNSILLAEVENIGVHYNEVNYKVRNELSKNMKQLIDGDGVKRIKQIIHSYEN